MGDLGLIPGLWRFPGEGKGYPLQYSGLENSMDYIVHGVANSRTQLSNWTELTDGRIAFCYPRISVIQHITFPRVPNKWGVNHLSVTICSLLFFKFNYNCIGQVWSCIASGIKQQHSESNKWYLWLWPAFVLLPEIWTEFLPFIHVLWTSDPVSCLRLQSSDAWNKLEVIFLSEFESNLLCILDTVFNV